jgi:hypothetical protein
MKSIAEGWNFKKILALRALDNTPVNPFNHGFLMLYNCSYNKTN